MLHDELKNLNKYPFHMPGHKRNPDFKINASEIDITEIKGFDNLHSPCGCISDTEHELERLYNSKRTFMLVNGSTVGILAAIFSFTKENDTVIIARNCHKSVYNAAFLRKLKIAYIEPEFDFKHGFYKGITQEAVHRAEKNFPQAKALVITSPTYEGYVSEIKSSLPVIVDAAHGAHFGFGEFPDYPKGDAVISSLHKTLPALTQTAVINVYNKKYIPAIKFYLDIFQTSSPSYVLMNSVSVCAEFLKEEKSKFYSLCNMLNEFYGIKLNNLKLITSDDKSKIIISCADTDINAGNLAGLLRDKYDIEPELQSINYVLLIASVGDTKNAFGKLALALKEIDKSVLPSVSKPFEKPVPICGCSAIVYPKKVKKTSFENCAGKISGEFIYAYPPDIPLVTPNQIITPEIHECIKKMILYGVNLISDSNLLPSFILTKDD